MAATNKYQLLELTQKEYLKLRKIIDSLDLETAVRKLDEDTSIKDVIGHRAHWIDLFFGWYADGLAGKTVHFPAEGYKWSELKRYNAALRQRQSDMDWPQVVALIEKKYAELVHFIEEHSDDELYGGKMKGGKNDWTTGRWAEAAGPSHFRSASRFARSALKADG